MAKALSLFHSAFLPSFLSFLRATCQIEKIRSEKKVWGGARQKQSQGTVESSQKVFSFWYEDTSLSSDLLGGANWGRLCLCFTPIQKTKKRRKVVVVLSKRRGEGRSPSTGFAILKVLLCRPSIFFLSPRLPPLALLRHEGGRSTSFPGIVLFFALTSGVVLALYCVFDAHRRGKGYFVGIKDQMMEGKGWIMNWGTNKNGGGDDKNQPNATSKCLRDGARARVRASRSPGPSGGWRGGGGGVEVGKRL